MELLARPDAQASPFASSLHELAGRLTERLIRGGRLLVLSGDAALHVAFDVAETFGAPPGAQSGTQVVTIADLATFVEQVASSAMPEDVAVVAADCLASDLAKRAVVAAHRRGLLTVAVVDPTSDGESADCIDCWLNVEDGSRVVDALAAPPGPAP